MVYQLGSLYHVYVYVYCFAIDGLPSNIWYENEGFSKTMWDDAIPVISMDFMVSRWNPLWEWW